MPRALPHSAPSWRWRSGSRPLIADRIHGSSWPGLTRPSTTSLAAPKTWMPGSSPGMTVIGSFQESKRRAAARHLPKHTNTKSTNRIERPGGTRCAPPGQKQLLLRLGLLGLLRLGLLRFLSHSILSRFNGLNATPRHALWRRANLATSSPPFPTDSRRTAACCHRAVIVLSTVVMRFSTHFLKFSCAAPLGADFSAAIAR